jgi:hypothetical protein
MRSTMFYQHHRNGISRRYRCFDRIVDAICAHALSKASPINFSVFGPNDPHQSAGEHHLPLEAVYGACP